MDDNATSTDNEQQQEHEAQADTGATYTPEQISAMAEELERLKSHHVKLLDETKTAKQKAQELDEQKRTAEEQRMKENQQFKELYEKTTAELESERSRAQEFQRTVEQREISSDSFKAAASIAVDDSSAELLSEKIAAHAKMKDGSVVYEIGGVEVPKEKIVQTISEKYPRLIKGSGAVGGGATGGDGSSAAKATKGQEAKAKGDLTGFLQAQLSK